MKLVLLALFAATLAALSIASADTAQGKLTGAATVGGFPFAIVNPGIDGGTSSTHVLVDERELDYEKLLR